MGSVDKKEARHEFHAEAKVLTAYRKPRGQLADAFKQEE